MTLPAVDYSTAPAAFFDRYITRNERGKPFRLFDHQREVMRLAFEVDAAGRFFYDTVIWACPKKSGKTTMGGAVTAWFAFTQDPPNEAIVCANDLEQSQGRAFKALSGLLTHNPDLRCSVEDQTQRSITLTNGTTISAIANEYAGAAGSNHGLTTWDELWGYVSERSRRLWDELTPVPTRTNSIRFITTYAGFEGESELLYELYKLAVAPDEHPQGQGTRLHATLPIYANRESRLFAYWDHQPRMPWQTPEYYAAQRRTLRPTTYLRLHENRWTSGVAQFITPELWDACVDAKRSPELAPEELVFVGVDAGIKHDTAAVVAVRWDGDKLAVVSHRIWKPTPDEPLDLEATIEAHLRELHARMQIERIVCDPYQLHRSITTLKTAGLPIQEFPQTSANTTAMGQTLFDLLNGRNLRVYANDELRQQALNTVAVESTRGWRIAKEKASRKIDAIVALAMACNAAITVGRREPLFFI
jgi:phage terminase large subunit-like protein